MIITGFLLALGWFLFDFVIMGAAAIVAINETHKVILELTCLLAAWTVMGIGIAVIVKIFIE